MKIIPAGARSFDRNFQKTKKGLGSMPQSL